MKTIFFVLANSVDPAEMPHNTAVHLGLYCFDKDAYRSP